MSLRARSEALPVKFLVRATLLLGFTATLLAAAQNNPGTVDPGKDPPRPGESFDPPAPRPLPPDLLDRAEGPFDPIWGIPQDGIGLPPGAINPERGEVHRHEKPHDGERPEPGPPATQVDDPAAQGGFRAPPLLQDFIGLNNTGLTPADPDIAVGPEHIVQVTNDDFAIYDKCGNLLFSRDINDFLGVTDFMFDPKVAYDPWNARWIMLWHRRNNTTQDARLPLVISTGGTPWGLGGWYWYNFNAATESGTNLSWADYYDLGFGPLGVYAAGDQFTFANNCTCDGNPCQCFRGAALKSWDKAEIYNALTAFQITDFPLTRPNGSSPFAPRAAKMQTTVGAGGVDVYLVESRVGGGSQITLWKLSDPFGAHTLTRVDINVGAYSAPPTANEPDGSTLDTLGARLMNCVVSRDVDPNTTQRLYAALATGPAPDVRIKPLVIDPIANSVLFDVHFGAAALDYWMPAVGVNLRGNAYFAFARSGAGEFPSLRYVDVDEGPVGTFTIGGSVQIKAGDANASDFRWGDYFGAQMDWADWNDQSGEEKIWMNGNYARSNGAWGTWIGCATDGTEGTIGVTPTDSVKIGGNEGGPFSPPNIVYTINNSGSVGFSWELLGKPSWLNTSSNGSQIDGGDNFNVTLTPNAAANALPPGVYTANLQFRDCYTGGSGTVVREVVLNVFPDNCAANRFCWDDVVTDGSFTTPVPGTYHGECWSNLCIAGGRWYADKLSSIRESTGSALPDISAPNVAYNGFGDVDCVLAFRTEPVNIQSCRITRWPNVGASGAAQVRFIGTLGGGGVFDQTVATVNNAWTVVNFGPNVVDRLRVTPPEGPLHWWLMDDLRVCQPCDTNCDGSINAFDIQPFTDALSPSPPRPCSPCAADTNGDGSVNAFDIQSFVECLGG